MRQADMARLYATQDGILSNHELDRIIHLVEIGTGQLAQDVETFKTEAERVPQARENMMMLVEQFQRYVDEGIALGAMLRCTRDASLHLAICGFDSNEVADSMTQVHEAVAEAKEG